MDPANAMMVEGSPKDSEGTLYGLGALTRKDASESLAVVLKKHLNYLWSMNCFPELSLPAH